jgi:hypothetical protein
MLEERTAGPSLVSVLVTGVISIIIVLTLAMVIIWQFEHHIFTDWVATAFMAATPTQMLLGLLWLNNKPDFINVYSAPIKGLFLTGVTILAGAIIMSLVLLFISGGHGITPMVVQFMIMTVVSTIWVLLIWQCWPAKLFTQDKVKFGLLSLLFSYAIAYLLWQFFFDYRVLKQIDYLAYHEDIDPMGLLDMWHATSFFVTTSSVIIVHKLFDFWPIRQLTKNTSPPFSILISSLYILVLSWLIRILFVNGLGFEQVDYMVRVPVCMIFGSFLITNMMQFKLFKHTTQPLKGFALLGCAIVLAVFMHELYAFAANIHTGKILSTGPKANFERELWIASAMLGVTFPMIFIISGFFNFWPIKYHKQNI